MEKDIELLEATFENGMIWLVLGSLISADSNMSEEDCTRNLEHAKKFLEAIDQAENIPGDEREKIKEYLQDGIRIIEQDLAGFMERKKEEGN